MSGITISGVSRTFGTVRAVDNVDLEVGEGEFFTLLGPSGCGKTTLLRMIAGFTELDSGEIRFGEKRIDKLPAHVRDIGMVFQNYAVFPNLTVDGNVAYGLKARRLPAAEIGRKVADALALVRLDGYGERWPHQLSGGQLQRVAIARALAIHPQVLLFDEPLSNLDARLRVSMRGEIRDLQKALGIAADGQYGPGTEKAVKDCQGKNGLEVDGMAGPATLAKLKIFSELTPEVVQRGALPAGATVVPETVGGKSAPPRKSIWATVKGWLH